MRQAERPDSEPSPSSDAPVASYGDLLRRFPAFRYLWSGQVVSFIGNWFNTIALYAAVQDLSDSGRAIALVMVAKTLPIFLMTPVSGPLIDRFDRRRLLLIIDFLRCACALGLIVFHQLGNLPGLYGCAVVMMAAAGVAVPTKNAAVPMIVPRSALARANALSGGAWSATLALGAALGGVVTQFFGITAAFVIDAGTFLLSAALISRLPPLPPPEREAAAARAAADPARAAAPELGGFVAGLRYLLGRPYVLALASLKSLMQLGGGLVAMIPLYGTVAFADASGALYVGLLYAARGAGAVIGALWVRSLFGDGIRTMRWLVLVGYAVMATSYLGLAQSSAYWHAAALYFMAAVGQSVVWVFSGTLLQLEADPRFHGRVFAIEFGVMTLVLAGSSYAAGAAVDWGIPLAGVAAAAAGMLAVSALIWLVVLVRGAR